MKTSSLFNTLWVLKHFFSEKLVNFLFSPLVKLQKKSRFKKLENLKTQKTSIDIIDSITPKEFRKKYLRQNKPVIIRGGAKDWPAVGKWDLDFFSKNFGDEVQPNIPTSGEEIFAKKQSGEKVDYYKLSDLQDSANKDKFYANFSPLVHKYKSLRDELKLDWLRQLQDKYSSLMMYQLFMGAKGKKTDLHSEISSNLFVMISGVKKWAMCSPQYNEFLEIPISREPCFHSPVNFIEKTHLDIAQKINYFEFDLYEGDILFVPPYFWHQVVNETQSVGLAIKWHNPISYMKSSITQSILTSFAVNPPIWKLVGKGNYLKLFTDGRE